MTPGGLNKGRLKKGELKQMAAAGDPWAVETLKRCSRKMKRAKPEIGWNGEVVLVTRARARLDRLLAIEAAIGRAAPEDDK